MLYEDGLKQNKSKKANHTVRLLEIAKDQKYWLQTQHLLGTPTVLNVTVPNNVNVHYTQEDRIR